MYYTPINISLKLKKPVNSMAKMVCAMLHTSDNFCVYITHSIVSVNTMYISIKFTDDGCLRRMNYRMVVAVLLVVVMGSIRVSEGQELPACATNVVPCMDFLNLTTRPPASCCDPLSQAVVRQLSCLCNLYTTPSFFESYSINFTLAIRLPSLCGISTDLTTCIGTPSLNLHSSQFGHSSRLSRADMIFVNSIHENRHSITYQS